MALGAFSLSLAVKDIHASKQFYETLGFTAMGGDIDQGWLILTTPNCTLGLFQGMFEKNMMTFNPGWAQDTSPLDEFEDVRAIQKRLKDAGIAFEAEADEATTGPAHFIIHDPDGNPIMLDQHVAAPKG